MKDWGSQVCLFLAQLAGFILGAGVGWLLPALGLWLVLGAQTGPDSGAAMFAPMLLVGPVGFFIGGFLGMRLAGKWVKESSQRDAERGSGGTPE